jgi:glycosyltransferase involved in cell wall biosynthesis
VALSGSEAERWKSRKVEESKSRKSEVGSRRSEDGSRKTVLWLIKGLGLGGAERLLVNALPYLDRTTFEYQVGYFLPWKDALVPTFLQQGIPVTCFGAGRPGGLGALGRVCRYLREQQIDVLHAHLPWASIVGRAAARRCGVPAVLYTEHGCWNRLNPVTRLINRLTLGWNDLNIAVSDEVRESMRGADPARIRTITNGIDCAALTATPDERGAVRAELGIPADHFLVVCVANLIPVKNHELLVRAFAQFLRQRPAATLVLVGQLRETTESVRRTVAELQLQHRVLITGPRTDVPRIVRAADAFAMSSHSEGLPISLLEAMALGKPVVCMRVGGIPGAVTDGVEGFLVPPGDAAAMAERLGQLGADAGLRARMGLAGQDKVRTRYDISVMVREVEGEYRKLLAAEKSRKVAKSKSR